MSSTQKAFAQIPNKIKYLRALDDEGATVLIMSGPTSSIMTDAEFSAAIGDSAQIAGALLKDLGREVVLFEAATGLYTAKYRAVQIVDGADTEGVPADWEVVKYVKVWDASGAGVYVVRTGPGA